MAKKTNNSTRLGLWMFWRPLQFSIVTFLIGAFIGLVYGGIMSLTTNTPIMFPTMTAILLALTFLIGTVWIIRKMPRKNLDQQEFVSISTALTVETYIFGAIFFMLLTALISTMPTPWMLLVVLAVSMFMLGLSISTLYVQYCRARTLGISRVRAICALPFGYVMLYPAGYVLGDKTDTKSTTKQTWYEKLVNWIIYTQNNALIAITVLMLIGTLVGGLTSAPIILGWTGLITFAIWNAISGPEKLKQNIHGAYSLVAVIFNMLMIIGILSLSIIRPTTPINLAEENAIEFVAPDINIEK